MLLGLIINPIAGMGGRVGLKGTDGREALEEALRRGAEPKAWDRAYLALSRLRLEGVHWVTWGGRMGETLLAELGFEFRVLGRPGGAETSAGDTREAASAMEAAGVGLLIFVGGDGTAVDIVETVDMRIPVLGVPSGVKMYSAVFASTPGAAAELIGAYVAGEAPLAEREVMDIDEEAYRGGRLDASLRGYVKTPFKANLVLSEKTAGTIIDEESIKDGIAERIVDEMRPGSLYILGPGSTVGRIAERMGLRKTLLGVDLVRSGELLAGDADEETILRSLGPDNWIILSPLGGQGSVLGRGNQQISSDVVRRVGLDHIIIVSTPSKLQGLTNLAVDTGDAELDDEFRGYRKVVTGFHESRLMKVA
jgi:predicted polyphosphate/ATP-dependent NAD kinase